ncbi:FtsX-like permease family protein [Spirosoma sp. SC4-14]|uniref:FtsX-like permease family protein n=1 Tax=Spirosoma sp. SC4-14 TaxID=3128900 RepID=UPI0030CEA961
MVDNPQTPNPPAWADRLITWVCPLHLQEELLGDLHEQFAQQVADAGVSRARQFYALEVLKFVRPYFIRRRIANLAQATTRSGTGNAYRYKTNDYPQPFFLHPDMLRNYLKIAFRTLWRSKSYASINVVGLSVAFCICLFLFLTAYLQLTYDSFHKDGDRIFQTYMVSNDPEKMVKSGTMPLPLMPALKADFPELEAATRVINIRKSLVEYKGNYFDKAVYLTDPDFFKIFSFPLIKGNPDNALRNLSSIVLSENMAKAIFGDKDPMGKAVLVSNDGKQKQYIVSGILGNAPSNSTIQYDALIRTENLPNYQDSKDHWDFGLLQVFIKLPATISQATFEQRLKPFVAKYYAGTLNNLKTKGAKPDERGDLFALRIQKIANIHFDRNINDGRGAPIALVYVLMGIATFILLIACINFINLSIARSFTRAKEVGVRKSLGALKKQLFVQIWGESTLICFAGFALGLLLAYLLLPTFNATFQSKLSIDYMLQPGFIALIFALFLVVTLVAGGYPAWQMARFNPVDVLKGKISLKRPGILRNSLIVSQFSISTLLACCTIIALQQVDYLREQPLGFQKEQVISIPVGNQVSGRQVLQRLRNKLTGDPSVLSITGSGLNLGRGKDHVSSRIGYGFNYKGKDILTDWLLVDYDYLKTLGIKLKAGRDFDRAYAADSANRVIVTESMAKMMGEANPVGVFLRDDTDTTASAPQIIGIVPDFHLYSLTDVHKPISMYLSNNEPIRYLFVRVAPHNLAGSMAKLQQVWKEIAPQSEFIGSFLDENVDAWYQNEDMLSRIFSLASGIAILLSCIGLFAIALMVIEQRTKEIGIRKVLGASTPNIIVALSQDFIKLVLIALAIAIPLAWFSMQQWLNNYPYHVAISVWVFVLVGLAAILIALATVSFHSIKAALMNPVKSLRTE